MGPKIPVAMLEQLACREDSHTFMAGMPWTSQVQVQSRVILLSSLRCAPLTPQGDPGIMGKELGVHLQPIVPEQLAISWRTSDQAVLQHDM